MNRTLWLMLCLALAGGSASSKNENFGGTWILDVSRPQPANAPAHLKMKIKQKTKSLTIESTFSEPADGIVPLLYLGIMAERLTLAIDGQQKENRFGPFLIQSKTVIRGNQMLTDWTASASGAPVQGNWTHTLKDPNAMILEIRESTVGAQPAEATLYFVRK